MRRLIPAGIASFVAVFALTISASPVAAECTYVPDWPKASEAIPSARAVIIGEPVTDFDRAELDLAQGETRGIALRVTDVVRGDYEVGDLVDIQYMEPNWPWGGDPLYGTWPSCSAGVKARPGEVIVLALGAVQPRQILRTGGFSWVQPRTVYNAMGLVDFGQRHYTARREFVTMQEIRRLAALPPTDMVPSTPRTPPRRPTVPILVFLAGFVGGVFAWRRIGSRGTRSAH